MGGFCVGDFLGGGVEEDLVGFSVDDTGNGAEDGFEGYTGVEEGQDGCVECRRQNLIHRR